EPKNVPAREILAGVAHTRGENGKALSVAQEAVALDPENEELTGLMYAYAYARAEQQRFLNDKEGSRILFEQVLLYDPLHVGANFYLGTQLWLEQKWGKALEYLHAA